jgi:hypothetical protein
MANHFLDLTLLEVRERNCDELRLAFFDAVKGWVSASVICEILSALIFMYKVIKGKLEKISTHLCGCIDTCFFLIRKFIEIEIKLRYDR